MSDVSRVHTGIVVYDDSSSESKIPAAVLDLDELSETGLPRVRQISREAFRLPREKANLEAAQRKNELRKCSKPLYFGDCIDFKTDNLIRNELIREIHTRLKPYIDSELVGGVKKICLLGIINPADPRHLFTEYFDKIEIPDEFVNEGYPNVCLQVWIELKYDFDMNRLDYEFHSFRGIAEEQMDISIAPWNKGVLQYSIVPIDDSDDDNYGGLMYAADSTGPDDRRPDMELYKKLAYMTGPRSFMLLELPQYKCIAPLKDSKLKVGNLYSVCCVWNLYDKMYMVTHKDNSNKKDPLPVHVNEDKTETLKCSVKAHETIPGIYYHVDFKYFDDPKGVLSLLHLTKFKSNAIPVSFVDEGPSHCGQFRFRIDKILGDKKKKLETFIQKEEIAVVGITGVVIGDYTVFSAEHGSLNFQFDMHTMPPSAGVWINFDASYNKEDKFFKITNWRINPEKKELTAAKRRMIAKKCHQKQLIFKVKVKTHNEKELNKMFFCAEFGLVDDNLGLVTLEKTNPRGAIYTVWVKRADADVKDNEARTPFHIIGVGNAVPNDRVEEPVVSEEHTELKRRFVEKMEIAAKNAKEVRTSRFSAPKRVKDAQVEVVKAPIEVKEAPEEVKEAPMRNPSSPRKNLDNLIDENINRSNSATSQDREERMGDRDLRHNFENVQISPKKSPSKRTEEVIPSSHSDYHDVSPRSSRMDEDRSYAQSGQRERRAIVDYTGAVRAPPGSDVKYDVPETIARLKRHVPHSSKCGRRCSISCPQVREIVQLMVRVDGFWAEADELYPNLTSVLKQDIMNVQ